MSLTKKQIDDVIDEHFCPAPKDPRNIPTEPGLYWASDLPMTEDWNMIAKVHGRTPFLQCSVWIYPTSQKVIDIYGVETLYFGPRIEPPVRDPRARPKDKQEEVH